MNKFVVSRFENNNGSFSWRVDGRLNGVRIRRNFKTQEEASAEKASLGIKAAQMESGRLNEVATFLSLEQIRDAEAAFLKAVFAEHVRERRSLLGLAQYRQDLLFSVSDLHGP